MKAKKWLNWVEIIMNGLLLGATVYIIVILVSVLFN